MAELVLHETEVKCNSFFVLYAVISLHTRHGMTIWVHLVWKDLSIC